MRGARAGRQAGSARTSLSDTVTLLRRYVVQETLLPLKHIGRSLAFGVAGALMLGAGSVVLLLALLRVLQTETGRAFAGSWSFAPFLLAALAALLAAGAAGFFGMKSAFGTRSGTGTKRGATTGADQGEVS